MSAVYMAVTADKYELPVFQADKRNDLAAMLGMNPNSISSAIIRRCVCKSSGMPVRVVKVILEDDEL